jgi:hypothetical protein
VRSKNNLLASLVKLQIRASDPKLAADSLRSKLHRLQKSRPSQKKLLLLRRRRKLRRIRTSHLSPKLPRAHRHPPNQKHPQLSPRPPHQNQPQNLRQLASLQHKRPRSLRRPLVGRRTELRLWESQNARNQESLLKKVMMRRRLPRRHRANLSLARPQLPRKDNSILIEISLGCML